MGQPSKDFAFPEEREWPQRKSLKVGEKNVQNPALAE